MLFKGIFMLYAIVCIGLLGLLCGISFAGARLDSVHTETTPDGDLQWYDLLALNIEGRGWDDVAMPYDRLPARAEVDVREPLWLLSQDSAGLCARFVTDATMLQARWTLRKAALDMPHMCATGVSGLDLYAKDENGNWLWLSRGEPQQAGTNDAILFKDIPPGPREYLLYLPLYNGVSSVELAVPKGSYIEQAPAYPQTHAKPIVFYGTSITQGGCASRPGMVHTAIVGRKLHRPVINLGFSGNGMLEMPLANLMAELDPAVFVVDCLPNLNADQVAERTKPFVMRLRESHPETPILLVEDRDYTNSFLNPSLKRTNQTNQAALRAAYDELKTAGVKNLYYLEGKHLLGDDNEGTVDGSHPTDLGFSRQAEVFYEAIKPLVE